MSKIYGSLHVTNSDWRYIYNTIINFFNQDIDVAYNQAVNFYNAHQELPLDDFLRRLNEHFETNEFSNFRKSLIKASLIKPNNKVVKPKKNSFSKFTNRTTYVHTLDVNLDFDKLNRTIKIETQPFDNFDRYMATNTFIGEFINMVNTINWPTREGPRKTTRGATLIRTDHYGNKMVFLSIGPNPPTYHSPTEVVKAPAFTEAQAMKNIRLTSTSAEETSQPVPKPQDLSGM